MKTKSRIISCCKTIFFVILISLVSSPLRNIPKISLDWCSVPRDITSRISDENACKCTNPQEWKAQTGQDRYLWERLFSLQKDLCCGGIFVEFGARNGIEHSNTYVFEKYQGWKGLLFEVDPNEYAQLAENRPLSHVIHGAICPSNETQVTIAMSSVGGWTGPSNTYDGTRKNMNNVFRQYQNITCHNLADELRQRNIHRVDYMTIDTEGSELDIVRDFPWNEFDVRVVQIEQLDARTFQSQRGKKTATIQHMYRFGYKLLSVYEIAPYDTMDLMFVRLPNNELLSNRTHRRDGGDATEPGNISN